MDFTSSVDDINAVTKQAKVTIPAAVVQQEYETTLTQATQHASLKGFRPGKAPKNMVEKLHGKRIRMEITGRLVEDSLSEFLREQKFDLAGRPEIVDISEVEQGKDLTYEARIDLYPKPEITGYDAFEVEVEEGEVSDETVDKAIDELRSRKAKVEKLQFRNVAEAGDVIDATLKVQIEGKEDEAPEPLVIALGEGMLPEELESAIPGMEVGHSKEVSGTIAEDHQNEEIRGKKVQYHITLNALSEKILPELNDEFAENLQFGVKTVLELRMKVREQLEAEMEQKQKNEIIEKTLAQLEERNSFDVPQVLIDRAIRWMLVQFGAIDLSKVDPKSFDLEKIDVSGFREKFGDAGTSQVRRGILVEKLAELWGIEVDEAKAKEKMKEMMGGGSEISDDELWETMKNSKEFDLEGFMNKMRDEQVFEKLRENTKVSYSSNR